MCQAIDDSEITCTMPTEVSVDSQVNLEMMTAAIKHTSLLGVINRKIGALKLKRTTLQELREVMDDLSQQLNDWWCTLPDFLKFDLRGPPPKLPPNVRFQHVAWHHFSYYESLVTIHSVLVHPWNAPTLAVKQDEKEELARLVATSTEIYLTATRKFILDYPQIKVTALCPKWYATDKHVGGLIILRKTYLTQL